MIVDNKAILADPPAYSGPTPIVSQPPPIPQPVAGPSNTVGVNIFSGKDKIDRYRSQ